MAGNQINVEYFFRIIYDCFHGGCFGSVGFVGFSAWLAHLWVWITILSYLLAAYGLYQIVYFTLRIFELRQREEKYYSTVISPTGAVGGVHPRWQHIEALAGSTEASEWREAIIEADIMLDDVLAQQGFVGVGIGEKLKSANFQTIQDAWEAHKVRNQIAHEGSAFKLSETIVQRTISQYENVFREFKAI